MFDGVTVHCNAYAITVKLTCRLDNKCYHITNIYGPSNPSQKQGFTTWLMNFDTSSFDDWALWGVISTSSGTLKTKISQG
jgi:hypothetical protein